MVNQGEWKSNRCVKNSFFSIFLFEDAIHHGLGYQEECKAILRRLVQFPFCFGEISVTLIVLCDNKSHFQIYSVATFEATLFIFVLDASRTFQAFIETTFLEETISCPISHKINIERAVFGNRDDNCAANENITKRILQSKCTHHYCMDIAASTYYFNQTEECMYGHQQFVNITYTCSKGTCF